MQTWAWEHYNMGLRAGDLKDLVKPTFEVDTYSSKMGEDKNIITLSFNVKSELPAQDLVKFFEAGYDFILDSAVSSGEQDDGFFRVFVEMPRNKKSTKNIMELLDGVKKLTGTEDYKFRYYKNFKSYDANQELIDEHVIVDPNLYGVKRKTAESYNADNFFSKSHVDTIILEENDILVLKKKYADPAYFKVVDFNTHNEIFNNLTESYNFNDFGEVIYLVKYIGDYDITKYGNKIIIENKGYCLVTERL